MTSSATAADVTRWLAVTRGLLEQPTAPLFEDLPRAHIAAAAREVGLAVSEDAAGNLVVRYGEADPTAVDRPPLVLVAHLDHPGFAVDAVDGDTVRLTFRGGLATAAVTPGSSVRFYSPGERAPVGHGQIEETAGTTRLTGAVARVVGGTAAGDGFAMWGFEPWDDAADRVGGRVCDDLVGAAAILCTLLDLAAGDLVGPPVWGLFTRAEEIGLLGAFEAIRLGTVPRDSVVLSLECSSLRAGARPGDGVVVRVGDRMSIFDPGVTAALVRAAEALAGHDAGFRFQRKLMDSGVCEATAFCAAGYRASGLALPLANYHNAADGGAGLAAENVHVDDFAAEVRLLLELARRPALLDPPSGGGDWLAERTARAREVLGAER